MIDQITAARLRGAAIRKFFDLGEPEGNPAPAGGQDTAGRADASRQQGAKSFHQRAIRIGLSKATRSGSALNRIDIVDAIARARPDAGRVIFPESEQLEHGVGK
jgi:hypothetical protein